MRRNEAIFKVCLFKIEQTTRRSLPKSHSSSYNILRRRVFTDQEMATIATNIHIRGLGRQAMSELTSKAKRLGITPDRYIKELVEEDLALDRKARTTPLAELMGPGREVDEDELGKLVEAARTRHHQRTTRKR